MKKLWIGGIILALLLFISLYWNIFNDDIAYLRSVPNSAVLLVETNHFQQTQQKLQETNFWLDLKQMDIVNKLLHSWAFMDTVLIGPSSKTTEQKLMASLHLTKVNDYDYLLLMHQSVLPVNMERLVARLKQQNYLVRESNFKGVRVYDIGTNKQPHLFAFAKDGKYIVGSVSVSLVEEAISQRRKSVNNNFKQATRWDSKKADLSLYLNVDNIAFLAGAFLEKTNNSFFDHLTNLVNWAQLDFSFDKKQLFWKGRTAFDKDNYLAQALLKQNPHTNPQIQQFLPSNTAFLFHASPAQFNSFYRTYKRKVSPPKTFKNHVLPWIGDEWAYGFTEPSGQDFTLESFFVAQTSNAKKAVKHLKRLSVPGKQKEEILPYKEHPIYCVDATAMVAYLVNRAIGTNFTLAYATVIDNYVVITPQLSHLKVLIEKKLADNTLANYPAYQTAQTTLTTQPSSTTLYMQPAQLKELLKAYASPEFKRDLVDKFIYYKRLSPVMTGFTDNYRKAKTSGVLTYQKQQQEEATLLWTAALDDRPAIAPQVVVNEKTEDKEILVQDESHHLYLITQSGQIRWRKNLDDLVLGEVQQIDFYNNGQLFYLFNTANKVYVLDNNGKDALNFPIRLSAKANTGLVLVDFDGNRDFNFFVPCANNQTYGYEYTGRPLPGWGPRKYLKFIPFPLRHFAHKGNDYLVAANKYGDVYLLNRGGGLVHKVALGEALLSAPEVDIRDGEPKIVATAKSGTTYIINVLGKYFTQKYKPQKKEQFITANVFGSESEENIFLSEGKIYVYSGEKELFSYVLPNGAKTCDLFSVHMANDNAQKIGLFCKDQQQIFLLQNYGKIHPDFPISASTPFITTDLFNSRQNILVVGGTDRNVVAYKLP